MHTTKEIHCFLRHLQNTNGEDMQSRVILESYSEWAQNEMRFLKLLRQQNFFYKTGIIGMGKNGFAFIHNAV